jgi:mono/diheme cytochrome c family protein
MKRVAANVIVIFAAILFASTSPLWQVDVRVPSESVLGLMRQMARSDPRSPASPPPVILGRDVYRYACAQCHGAINQDLGIGLQGYRPLAEYTPRDIYQLITWGKPVTLPEGLPYTGKPFESARDHPAFPAQLTEAERWGVSEYVYNGSLEPGDGLSGDRWVEAWKSRMNFPTSDKAASGSIYGSYCANCHGTDGYGNGEYASDLIPHPRDLRDTAWLANQSFEWLFSIIKTGKTGEPSEMIGENGYFSGMPPFGELLDDNQVEAVVNSIEEWGYSLGLSESRWSSTEGGPIAPDSNTWRWEEIRSILGSAPENPPAWMADRDESQ